MLFHEFMVPFNDTPKMFTKRLGIDEEDLFKIFSGELTTTGNLGKKLDVALRLSEGYFERLQDSYDNHPTKQETTHMGKRSNTFSEFVNDLTFTKRISADTGSWPDAKDLESALHTVEQMTSLPISGDDKFHVGIFVGKNELRRMTLEWPKEQIYINEDDVRSGRVGLFTTLEGRSYPLYSKKVLHEETLIVHFGRLDKAKREKYYTLLD